MIHNPGAKDPKSDALVRVADASLVAADTSRADHYARASRSDRTWKQYGSAFRQFEAWCVEHSHSPLPASTPTLRAYMAWLADHDRTVATINAYVAAIATRHSGAGLPFERSALKNDLKGIRRVKAQKPRQARPLVSSDLRALLGGFKDTPSDDRDRLLLALGFAGAFRRSELVGLDWKQHGDGTGFIVMDDRGVVVTLLNSKGGKGEPEEIIIPCSDMPTVCEALEQWASVAQLQPGKPVFREVIKGGEIGRGRLTDRSVARIIKRRVRSRALVLGKTEADADELASLFSGHSLRAGYCTAAAMAGLPEWKIRGRSRHKTAALVARYVRVAEEWTDSGLKGVGF